MQIYIYHPHLDSRIERYCFSLPFVIPIPMGVNIRSIIYNIHIVDVDNTSNTKKADELSTQYKQEIKDNQPGKKWKGSSFYEWQYKWCIWIDTESNIYNNIFWRTKWNKIS